MAKILHEALEALPIAGRRVLIVVPDATRTLPMAALFKTLCDTISPRARNLRFLVALGTHPQMTPGALAAHLGYSERPENVTILQHQWQDPNTLVSCGSLDRSLVRTLSRGLIDEEVEVRLNREVLEADLTLLVGPVFPHELIGFSGGHKYLFPGVSGPEMVDYTHWLGGLMTNPGVHGIRDTPPRAMIETAAGLVPGQRFGLCLAMSGSELRGMFLGGVAEAWKSAVALSTSLNIVRTDRRYHTVVACVPERYEDLWTGSKCMTKLEAVVEDGGTLILLAPHITSPSVTHTGWHERIGYHVRDFILAHHRERYSDIPLAVLADLMQLPGVGTYTDGIERRRIEVLLATGIPEETCRRVGLGYRDPRELRLAALEGRESEGILVVEESGEMLYRVRD